MCQNKQSDIEKIELKFPDSKKNIPAAQLSPESARAIKDLIENSHFRPLTDKNAPYRIVLSIKENRLIFQLKNAKKETLPLLILSLSPYRRPIKDYFMIIDSYEKFRRQESTSKLETIDMARRGIHNEAAEMIMERLEDKIEMDMNTARRIFTLICALHVRNTPRDRI